MAKIQVVCKECGKIVLDYLCNGRQFCSRECKLSSKEVLLKISEGWYKKGHKLDAPFPKGNQLWKVRKVHKEKCERGPDRYNWKGNNVGYVGLHNWVKLYLGKPDTCEHCFKAGLKGAQIHWANKSRKYKRELSDWLRLCARCHWRYDHSK